MFWTPGPEEAQAAELGLAGGFGAFIHAYLRHLGSLLKAAGGIVIGIGSAIVFAPHLVPLVKLTPVIGAHLAEPLIPTAVLVGLTSKALAEKALATIEGCDPLAYFKRKE
jgi:hypothetical protein